MIIGVPKEIKEHEYRVSVTPAGVRELVADGNTVIVEQSAGVGSGFSDAEYEGAGADLSDKKTLFSRADLIVKVKEPVPSEFEFFQEGQAVFTFLHLAANPNLTDFMLKRNITGFAYETLEKDGTLPLLKPMSEIAGRMAPIVGAYYLQKVYGGAGVLVTGVSGVAPANFLILGAGTVGMGALQVAYGMGANVTVINKGEDRLKAIDRMYQGKVKTVISTDENIETETLKTDVLIGAVLLTGAKAPRLVSKELVAKMKTGSVIVDVSVDQGGCVETTKPTTHTDPVYTVDGVIHYTVANMPGAYPRTSTLALTGITLEYIRRIAMLGIEKAVGEDGFLKGALNTYKGSIMHKAIEKSIE
jgi:alanine dehydrogenase